MTLSRRKFLQSGAAMAAIVATPSTLMSCVADNSAKLKNFGLQLYTVRDVMPNDRVGVLKQVAKMGYTQIESFEGKEGMFWGMTNLEFKKLMDDLNMAMVSSHTDINKDFERKAAEAAEIGMKYLIDPWEGPQKTIDDFKVIADKFNEKGHICKKNGIRFAYHNHDYSFKQVDGQVPQDVMMQGTDPDLVDFEMDIYWVVTAGEDPEKWFEKYPGRFRLSHIKDRKKNAPLSDRGATCVVGKGEIDFPEILKTGKKYGLEYYFVEQEQYNGMTSLEAAKQNADYLKKLRIKG